MLLPPNLPLLCRCRRYMESKKICNQEMVKRKMTGTHYEGESHAACDWLQPSFRLTFTRELTYVDGAVDVGKLLLCCWC
jgi:hypothetical protein